jgi:uncharacterized protein (DUF1800 family)
MRVWLGTVRDRRGAVAAALAVLLAGETAVAQVRPADRRGGGSPGTAEAELIGHVIDRITYGRNEAMLASIQSLGVDEFILRQLNPSEIAENPVLTQKLALLPPPYDIATGKAQWDLNHLYGDFLLRATYSNRQLQEVMTEFWENHFDTQVPAGATGTDERFRNTNWVRLEKQAFRDNALGNFRDLLAASAHSAAMMYFLNNYENRRARGNENYARELLELHTLGVDNGYTQNDVQNVAKAFTGWGIFDYSPGGCDAPSDTWNQPFCFSPPQHDGTAQVVMGVAIPAGQRDMGERILDLLASHPGTAYFICTKLVQKFVADQPPARLVDDCSGTFLRSDGDMRSVLKTILYSAEFRDPAHRQNKVRTPLELVIASVRNLEGDTDGQNLWNWIANMGQIVFQNAIPTGYAEVGDEWTGTNQLLQRWKWADTLTQYALPAPPAVSRYYVDPWEMVNRLGVRTPEGIVKHFLALLVRGHHSSSAEVAVLTTALMNGQTTFNFDARETKTGVRAMVGIILGFPEYEKQ